MCGRYVSPDIAEAERYFLVHILRWKFERWYNVAPTQQVPVVRIAGGKREGVTLRCGLLPFFAKGVPPNPLMAEFHKAKQRMPAILQSAEFEAWLTGSVDDVRAALKPYPADAMVAWPVSTRTNSPKNNDATLVERLSPPANRRPLPKRRLSL